MGIDDEYLHQLADDLAAEGRRREYSLAYRAKLLAAARRLREAARIVARGGRYDGDGRHSQIS